MREGRQAVAGRGRAGGIRAAFVLSCTAFSCIGLAGCAAVDGFAPRASAYNAATADTKSLSVLANIMRAAYARPLQFTDVTTVAGQGSLSGTLSASLPLAGGPATAPQVFSIAPSATAANTSTFNVANLNTQEFYYGLQAPLSTQLIASYLNAGFPPDILLPLIVSDIEVETAGTKTIFHNRADDPATFGAFYSAMQDLIANGLSYQEAKAGAVGPLLTREQAENPRIISAIIATTGTDAPDLKEASPGRFQLIKKQKSYELCFDTAKAAPRIGGIDVRTAERPSKDSTLTVPILRSSLGPGAELLLRVDARHICGSMVAKDAIGSRDGSLGTNFSLRPRSVEGIFYFLGEMVRTQLGLGARASDPLRIPLGKGNYFYLFRVQPGVANEGGMRLDFDGVTYQVGDDPSGLQDGSSRVLQLLTDLLALQSSAKNLPAPNLISVLAP